MFSLKLVSENAIMLYLGDRVDPLVAALVQAAVALIEDALGDELIDLVPSYASVMIIYDATSCSHREVCHRVKTALAELPQAQEETGKLVTLPVYYSVETGPDLEALAQRANLDIEGVIDLHSAAEYRVYAIGFAPGFAYLGTVDARIAAPRLATPRSAVPQGSVALADRQSAVYPNASPGGWNLLGRCPLTLFDPITAPHMPFAVGDRVQFEPVSRKQFLALGGTTS